MKVPRADQVTPEWMASALGFPGELESFEAKSIGTGQVGENVRYLLRWADWAVSDDDQPRVKTVVGKFPALDEQSRQTALAVNAYQKEVGFYRDLQSTVHLRTPTIYYQAEDTDENAFTLVMEDIGDAVQGDQLAGCTLDHGELAISAMAQLHAPHWGSTELTALPWIDERTPDKATQLQELIGVLVGGFCDRYRERLAPEVLEAARWIHQVLPSWHQLATAPLTLVHGDFRLDNMLFRVDAPSGQAGNLTVVDWQTAGVGHGATDLAYFIGSAFLADHRQIVEDQLVRAYVDQLVELGVTISFDDVWHDYRLGSASGLIMAIIASQIVGRTDRGDEMFCVMAERHAAQMHDLELRSLLV